MFDFEKLLVYQKAKTLNRNIRKDILIPCALDISTKSQLSRAALSIILNIAEGAGRFTKPDKKKFYIIARGSLFECVALCDFLYAEKIIPKNMHDRIYEQCEELSKMLYKMIRQLSV